MPKKESKKEKTGKLKALRFALAGGITTGICVFITTILAIIIPGYATLTVSLIKDIYGFLGYNASIPGAILGAIYGFVDGFILTGIFALVYNKLV